MKFEHSFEQNRIESDGGINERAERLGKIEQLEAEAEELSKETQLLAKKFDQTEWDKKRNELIAEDRSERFELADKLQRIRDNWESFKEKALALGLVSVVSASFYNTYSLLSGSQSVEDTVTKGGLMVAGAVAASLVGSGVGKLIYRFKELSLESKQKGLQQSFSEKTKRFSEEEQTAREESNQKT
jgi:hypothetical protein